MEATTNNIDLSAIETAVTALRAASGGNDVLAIRAACESVDSWTLAESLHYRECGVTDDGRAYEEWTTGYFSFRMETIGRLTDAERKHEYGPAYAARARKDWRTVAQTARVVRYKDGSTHSRADAKETHAEAGDEYAKIRRNAFSRQYKSMIAVVTGRDAVRTTETARITRATVTAVESRAAKAEQEAETARAELAAQSARMAELEEQIAQLLAAKQSPARKQAAK